MLRALLCLTALLVYVFAQEASVAAPTSAGEVTTSTAALENVTRAEPTTQAASKQLRCKNYGCSHDCQMKWKQDKRRPVCVCPEGMVLSDSDKKQCIAETKAQKEARLCTAAHCSHICSLSADESEAVCSCNDERMKLDANGHTCVSRGCRKQGSNPTGYACGDKAICTVEYDSVERINLPKCRCEYFTSNMLYNDKDRSCKRNPAYKDCQWPTPNGGCQQNCKVRYTTRASAPQCTCKPGYQLNSNGHTCRVTDYCKASGNNAGCNQRCTHVSENSATCSCWNDDYTMSKDRMTCILRSCANQNSGCQQGCVQLDNKNYICTCDKGWRKDPKNNKKCYDYNECSGFHGCEQKCESDGNHFYKCSCLPGFKLRSDGYSCERADRCLNHKCSQQCDPNTGQCSCDKFHVLAADGVTCEDKNECLLGEDNCAEKCVNTIGGFSCACNNPKATLSNDLRTCRLSTCVSLSHITSGSVKCIHGNVQSDEMEVNDYCEFSCDAGYRLEGHSRIRCTPAGYDYVPPICKDRNECSEGSHKCAAGEQCTNTLGGHKCHCTPGLYRIAGVCKDITPPLIRGCPTDIYRTVGAQESSVTVSWKKPLPYDPSGIVNCNRCPVAEKQTLGIGDHKIQYEFADSSGNIALCSFKVKVLDNQPPVISGCPNGTVFYRDVGSYSLSDFATVKADDNSGTVHLTTDAPAVFNQVGETLVNYYAKDPSGNTNTCSFTVNITKIECPALRSPANGEHGCDNWHAGVVCKPRCNAGFGFYEPPADSYHCGDNGEWTPQQDIPDCVAVGKAKSVKIWFSSSYTNKCPSHDEVTQILGFITLYFSKHTAAFCEDQASCALKQDSLDVTCSDDIFTVRFSTTEEFSGSEKDRQEILTQFRQRITEEAKKNGALMSISLGAFNIVAPIKNNYASPVSVSMRVDCPANFKEHNLLCVPCPGGGQC